MSAQDTKVFIGGLLPTTSKESLVQHLSVFGELLECNIVLDKQTGLSKGYGFAVFASPEAAEASTLAGYLTIEGKNCNCNLASLRKKPSDVSSGSTPSTPNNQKKRGFPNFNATGGYEYDKRQRTEAMVYTPHVQPYTVAPMVADPNQSFQMQVQSSMQTLYADFQGIKYEVSVLNQNVHHMKQMLTVMKTSLDAICQRNGIMTTPFPLQ